MIALPGVCQGCRAPVIWNGKRWRKPGRGKGVQHVCQPDGSVVCGTLLPRLRERCARRIGHGFDHRSRYALDNAVAAKRKWRAA